MTNPRCTECHGRGYTNEVVAMPGFNIRFEPPVMQICQAPDTRRGREGQVCTPHTNFRHYEPVRGDTSRSNRQVRLPSDKRRETRAANQAKKGGFDDGRR